MNDKRSSSQPQSGGGDRPPQQTKTGQTLLSLWGEEHGPSFVVAACFMPNKDCVFVGELVRHSPAVREMDLLSRLARSTTATYFTSY